MRCAFSPLRERWVAASMTDDPSWLANPPPRRETRRAPPEERPSITRDVATGYAADPAVGAAEGVVVEV